MMVRYREGQRVTEYELHYNDDVWCVDRVAYAPLHEFLCPDELGGYFVIPKGTERLVAVLSNEPIPGALPVVPHVSRKHVKVDARTDEYTHIVYHAFWEAVHNHSSPYGRAWFWVEVPCR